LSNTLSKWLVLATVSQQRCINFNLNLYFSDETDIVPSLQGEDEDMSQDQISKQKMEIFHTSQPDMIQTFRWMEIREAHHTGVKFVWTRS